MDSHLQSFNLQGYDDDDEKKSRDKRIFNVNDPVDALSANREETMFVAAGSRQVLRVFQIVDDGIEQVIDLRTRSRRLNLLYSPSNVAWSPLKDDLIATTSTNGAVVLWNLNKGGKQDLHYKAHTRSATVLSFHRSNENLLISGSKDASVLMYDIRESAPVKKFSGGSFDTIRDLSFCLHAGTHDSFLTADDSGNVRLWDSRREDKPVNQINAHHGYTASIALNPNSDSRHMVASGGGRDKFIKIWDWSITRPSAPVYQVETMAPVGRVYWKPDKPWQIVNCAVVNDLSVYLWDIRRPYIPFASCEGHKDSVTDIWMSSRDGSRFVTSGKDGRLILHDLADCQNPMSYACDVALDLTPDGLVCIAVSSQIQRKVEHEMDPICRVSKLSLPGKAASFTRARIRSNNAYDPFRAPIKSMITMGIPSSVAETLGGDTFHRLAQGYMLGDRPVSALCEYNSQIAMSLNQEHIAQSWKLAGVLLEQMDVQKVYDEDKREAKLREAKRWAAFQHEMERQGRTVLPEHKPNLKSIDSMVLGGGWEGHHAAEERKKKIKQRKQKTKEIEKKEPETITIPKDERKKLLEQAIAMQQKRKPAPVPGEFYFGEGELRGASCRHTEEPRYNDFTGLKEEAFEIPQRVIDDRYATHMFYPDLTKDEYDPEEASKTWNPLCSLSRLLLNHEAMGDLQTCASIAVVGGRLICDEVFLHELTVEAWIESYIEMLNQLELYVPAALLRKFTHVQRIRLRTQEGTFQRLVHSENSCLGLISQGRCTKCNTVVTPQCAKCRSVIRGMCWTCSHCRHSYHITCQDEWFLEGKNVQCSLLLCDCDCRLKSRGYQYIEERNASEKKPQSKVLPYVPKENMERAEKLIKAEAEIELASAKKSIILEPPLEEDEEKRYWQRFWAEPFFRMEQTKLIEAGVELSIRIQDAAKTEKPPMPMKVEEDQKPKFDIRLVPMEEFSKHLEKRKIKAKLSDEDDRQRPIPQEYFLLHNEPG